MRMTLDNLVTGLQDEPDRVVLYGVDGIGKSTFAANAPNPVFIGTEKGTNHLDITRFPTPETWDDIFDAIGTLYEQDHNFKTLVIDSIDWAEDMARQKVCDDNNVTSIEQIPYGKGWKIMREMFPPLLQACDALAEVKRMHIILIAHSEISRFADPENDDYDRYSVKLDQKTAAKVREWSDYVLFANYDTDVKVEQQGLKKTVKGVSYGKRLLHTQRRAAYDAKSRESIPERLPLDWNAFESAIAQAKAAKRAVKTEAA